MKPLRRAPQLLALIVGCSSSGLVLAQAADKSVEPQAMSAELAAPLPAADPAAQVVDEAQAAPAEQAAQQLEQPAGPRAIRNVVVPQFTAPAKSRARQAVLRTLADHPEVEVVSIDDVTFASHRLQADPTSAEGRAKLSRELGIDAWLDGQITDSSAHLTLTAGDGSVLQEVAVEAEDERHLDALTGERMWAALGTRLSPQEAYRRAVLAEYDRARHKYDARLAESQRQIEVAHAARAHRAFVLRGQFALAQRKRAALAGELGRQTDLGKAELAREAEAARQAQLAREAEAARLAAVAKAEAEARRAAKAKAAEDARQAQLAKRREREAAQAAASEKRAAAKAAAAEKRLAGQAAAADRKAKAKADRAEAKRKRKAHRAGSSAMLTNTSAQRAHAAALAKKKAGGSDPATRRDRGRSPAADSGKEALSKQ
jgi:hypothetical protein